MHEYSLSNYSRTGTFYWIAVISSFAGWGLGSLISIFNANLGLFVAAPSGLTIYLLLFKFFNEYIWKCKYLYNFGLVKIPNLNGTWDAKIITSDPTSNAEKIIPARVEITQTYTSIFIEMITSKSKSESKMATIETITGNSFKLRYEYSARFNIGADIPVNHNGVSQFELKSLDHDFKGPFFAGYYTESKRDTNGKVEIIKK